MAVLYIVSVPDEPSFFAFFVILVVWVIGARLPIIAMRVNELGVISDCTVNMPVVVWIEFPYFVVCILHHHLAMVVVVVVIFVHVFAFDVSIMDGKAV